jgi:hypothetical protein
MDKVEQLEERNTKNSIKIRMLEEMGKGYDKAIPILKKAMSGFSSADSKFISIVRRAQMVSAGDNGIYTSSGLRGVIPYVQ